MNYLMTINGASVGKDLEQIEVVNPGTNEIVGTIPKGSEKESEQAIDAADAAFEDWADLTAYDRAAYLMKLYDLVIENKEELGRVMTMEMGKPINESIGEVMYGASFLQWFAEEGKRIYGQTVPAHVPNKRLQVWKKPVGVVAAITPWNFPLAMLTRKVAPALAAGCTVIMKPSSESPLTAGMFMDLINQAGFPKGVINLVTGSSSKIVGKIMKDSRVRKVTFTGSTEVGKLLIKQSADNVKNLSLELGGHAPLIVLNDADVDVAVKGVMDSKFRNAGQTCICANRIYVQSGIYDEFVERFSEAVQELKVGDGLDSEVDIGPLINQDGLEKVMSHVEDAIDKGGSIVYGGKSIGDEDSLFYEPTVIRDVKESMIIMQEETFGPIAPVQKIETIEEAIEQANDTEYGLAAYVFTENVSKGMTLIEKLDFGIVGWNDGGPSAAQVPFGGMKESGVGREGGSEGIEAFIESQYVSVGLK